MNQNQRVNRLVRALLLPLLLAGCFGPEPAGSEPERGNRAAARQPGLPSITPAAPVLAVDPGKVLTLRAHAEGAERYEWSLQGKGSLGDPKVPVAVYTAPEEGNATAVLTVIAYNGSVASPAASVEITVRSPASVPLDALGIPAGWMSGEENPSRYISLRQGSQCRPGSRCTEIVYRAGGGWGGFYWWPPSCGPSGTKEAWDRVRAGTCAIDLGKATGMHEITRLAFWARGQRGGEVVELKIGGSDVLPIPGRSLGGVTLTQTWTQYSIDLQGVDLSKAVGLFAWIATDLDNPQGATFLLQDIRFEGFKP